MATLSLCLASVAVHAAEPPQPDHSVKAPHYGDVLFHFFQDHPFPALTGLMVSQHFERLPHHEDEAEVLRGGLLLDFGLHREAGDIFARLIERGAEPAVRDRAWFFLAKIRYQRGSPAEAGAALARIERPLPGALQEERLLLGAQVAMARGDYAAAAGALQAMLADPAARPKDGEEPATTGPAYARFNLGVALIRNGDLAGGRALLETLGRTPSRDEEVRTLRDQANVALGFAALAANEPEAAAAALERVRLVGMHSNKALLGFGWAAAAQKKPARALVPWSELAGREPSDPAVLEARIAVPYALAELGAYGQALTGYQAAIGTYDQEGRALDESIAAVRAGTLLTSLVERNPAPEMGWYQPLAALPEMPHQGHLAPVLARHDFQEAFKNYRDLRYLAGNLAEWQDKLGLYRDMLDTRRQAFTERAPRVRQQATELSVDLLQRRRDALAAEFQRADAAADGVAYADPNERAQQARLAAARQLLAREGANAELNPAEVDERLRRLQGALTWQLAQALPERRWSAEKALRATDVELADARTHDAGLARAQRDEPARFEAFAGRIGELAARIRALQPRVAALTAEQQQALQDNAVTALKAQQERLVGYTAQARYAVAQLYDLATSQDRRAAPEGLEPARGAGGAQPGPGGTQPKGGDRAKR